MIRQKRKPFSTSSLVISDPVKDSLYPWGRYSSLFASASVFCQAWAQSENQGKAAFDAWSYFAESSARTAVAAYHSEVSS